MKELSLEKYCIPCGSECCKTGDSIASPILSHEEMIAIHEETQKDVFTEVKTPSGIYYIIKEQQGTNRCSFLTEQNKCSIQDVKPMDCLCYPIKAAYYYDGRIQFVIDTNCPATKHLSPEFIEKAKEIALKSLFRFNRRTYQHWIDTQEVWAKDPVRLEDFLETLEEK